jgi:hypothetical protein
MVLLSLSEQDRGMKERREGLLHSAFFSWLCVSEIGFFFFDTTLFSQAWGDTTPPPTYYTQPGRVAVHAVHT